MIQHPTSEMLPQLKAIWREVFADNDAYIDLIFSKKYQPENTLVALVQSRVVAVLHLHTYCMRWHERHIPLYYLNGLATLPPFRGRGLMAELITSAHRLMAERNIPLSLLVPADENLTHYYCRFGYETVSKSELLPSVCELVAGTMSDEEAFARFDAQFNSQNLAVEKTFADFLAILCDARIDDFPPKFSLEAMAKIIQPECIPPAMSEALFVRKEGKIAWMLE